MEYNTFTTNSHLTSLWLIFFIYEMGTIVIPIHKVLAGLNEGQKLCKELGSVSGMHKTPRKYRPLIDKKWSQIENISAE